MRGRLVERDSSSSRRPCGRCWSSGAGPATEDRAKARAKLKGGLNLTTRAGLLAGGDSGPAVVAGKPEDSLLVRAIRYHDEPRMPPEKRLGEVEIQNLGRWVELGLPWPSSPVQDGRPAKGPDAATPVHRRLPPSRPGAVAAATTGPSGRWPTRPLPRSATRPGRSRRSTASSWPGWKQHGLTPAPAADRRTLIRRATFDLTGLPPTPEEVEAFLADDRRPTPSTSVVDRLLASPHYGERWGRHWLDLARYADTAGETADFPVPEAYRYRDYVIDAFNARHALRPVPPRAARRRPARRRGPAEHAAPSGSSPPASWPSPAGSASTRRTTIT